MDGIKISDKMKKRMVKYARMSLKEKGPILNERIGEEPEQRSFNANRNHPQYGDEWDFIRGRKSGENIKYMTSLHIEPDTEYEFEVRIRSCMPAYKHNRRNRGSRDTTLYISDVFHLEEGHNNRLRAIISAKNVTPPVIWASCELSCDQSLIMTYLLISQKHWKHILTLHFCQCYR